MIWTRASITAIIVVCVAACPKAENYTYYVSTTGSDTNPGTDSKPWRTIQKAADTAKEGESVLVRGGVYAEKVTFENSGVEGKPIVFESDSNRVAVIDGQDLGIVQYNSLVEIRDVHYLTLSGFEVRNSGYRNIHIGGESTHITLKNLDVHDGQGDAQIIADGPDTAPAFSVISGCKVHDGPGGGICLWYATGGYWMVKNNEVYGNTGTGNWDGVQVSAGHHVVVKNNTIHDNATWTGQGADNLDMGGHTENNHFLVESNTVYGSHGSFKLHSGWNYTPGVSSFHIARFNRFTGIPYVCYDFPDPIVVYNNTFVDGGQFVMFYSQNASEVLSLGDSTYSGGDTGRMNWKNNIFFQETRSSAYALLVAPDKSLVDVTYASVRFQHSLYRLTNQRWEWGDVFSWYNAMDASSFAQYQSSGAPDYPDTGSILTDATAEQTFADYAARDYRLTAGSPAIDKGIPLTTAVNSGTKSTTLVVDRASYFHDGFPVDGEYLNTPDSIVIGANAAVAIASIDDANNTITLASPVSWSEGDSVTLPYKGAAPDIGAFENR